MTKKRYHRMETGNESSGVQIEHDAKESLIRISGYFDGTCGHIQQETMTAYEFCQRLGLFEYAARAMASNYDRLFRLEIEK